MHLWWISRILLSYSKAGYLSFIWVGHCCRDSSCLPPSIICIFQRAARYLIPSEWSKELKCTWHFSPQGLSHSPVARIMRVLLPHVFTFITRMCESLVSVALSVSWLLMNPSVRWCGALRCPDFPLFLQKRQNGQQTYKVDDHLLNLQIIYKNTTYIMEPASHIKV